jgi:hypothetical protein
MVRCSYRAFLAFEDAGVYRLAVGAQDASILDARGGWRPRSRRSRKSAPEPPAASVRHRVSGTFSNEPSLIAVMRRSDQRESA